MGLDMYLTKQTYIGAKYEHRGITGTIDIRKGDKTIPIELNRVAYIVEEVGYWRKANQIHGWFVDNIQRCVDDGENYPVSYDKLMHLKQLCQEVLETRDFTKLPPSSGCFFGSVKIDNDYWLDLKETIEIISKLAWDGDYYYKSSW